MKNTKVWTRVLGIIAMVAMMGFGFTACEDGGGGGGGGSIDVTVINNNEGALTNIKITAIVDNEAGPVLYDSGSINITTDSTHSFTVKNIPWSIIGTHIGNYAVTVGESTKTGNIQFSKEKNPYNLQIKASNGDLATLDGYNP